MYARCKKGWSVDASESVCFEYKGYTCLFLWACVCLCRKVSNCWPLCASVSNLCREGTLCAGCVCVCVCVFCAERRLHRQSSIGATERPRRHQAFRALPVGELWCQPWSLALGRGANLPQRSLRRPDHHLRLWLCPGSHGVSGIRQRFWRPGPGTSASQPERFCHERRQVRNRHWWHQVLCQTVRVHAEAERDLHRPFFHSCSTQELKAAGQWLEQPRP